jgi:multimeric flavodoxin WrbA
MGLMAAILMTSASLLIEAEPANAQGVTPAWLGGRTVEASVGYQQRVRREGRGEFDVSTRVDWRLTIGGDGRVTGSVTRSSVGLRGPVSSTRQFSAVIGKPREIAGSGHSVMNSSAFRAFSPAGRSPDGGASAMVDSLKGGRAPEPRKGMPSPRLTEEEFRRRFRGQFKDPAFDALLSELEKITDAAWDAYAQSRKAPRTRKAGPEFADPDYALALDWLRARDAIHAAQRRHDDAGRPARILVINGSSRSEHTCPGEMSKSYRLVELAMDVFRADGGVEAEVLDLSRLASEYGRNIHPCKACFSTAPALCHWPCSCYPNYSLGQTQDWMNDIYPMWVAAHGIMIVGPVNWYQVSSPLKLMMDRLVCADGGNPDPTRTHGKDAREAKEIELAGWDYPRHLAGRLFAVVVHGDVAGVENVRRSISDWLCYMHLCPAGPNAELDRYIGYWKPYATSHDELDADTAIQQEVRNAARTLLAGVQATRAGQLVTAGEGLELPRQK